MANFALIKNNIVLSVIVIDNNIITDNGSEVEQLGIDFINSLNIKGVYDYDVIRQTSYNGNFRSKYAGIGDTWDETNNIFISPKPFVSWTLNNNFKWEAPLSYPSSGNYTWNESTLEWIPALIQ
jgi:hypothetical protein